MADLIELERVVARLSRELRELRESLPATPARRARPTGGSGDLDFGVIRQIDSGTAPYVWVTPIEELAESPWWRMPANTASAIRTQPGTFGRHYQQWLWTGEPADEYPKDWAAGMRIMGMLRYRGHPIVMCWPLIISLEPVPEELPMSDGRLVASGVTVELLGA